MNACDYGVPQNRKRWYCVGFKKNLEIGFEGQEDNFKKIYRFPEPTELTIKVKDIIETNVDAEYNVT